MPALVDRRKHQKAVLWERLSDDTYGRSTFSEAVEIDVRWENRAQQVMQSDGTTIGLDAIAVVSQDVPNHSLLWLGELADWAGTGTGNQDNELMMVAVVSEVPDIRGRTTRRILGLQRYQNTPGEGATY